MNKNRTIRLESERLILRKLIPNDAEEMFRNWSSDTTVTEYISWDAHKNVEETRQILKNNKTNYKKNENYLSWGIVIKSTNELIGNISAIPDKDNIPILGWVIGRKWWGQGYVPEAAAKILDYLFCKLGAEEVKSCHNVKNAKSGRVMQKIGMHFVEECSDTYNGKIARKCWYRIKKEEFLCLQENQSKYYVTTGEGKE